MAGRRQARALFLSLPVQPPCFFSHRCGDPVHLVLFWSVLFGLFSLLSAWFVYCFLASIRPLLSVVGQAASLLARVFLPVDKATRSLVTHTRLDSQGFYTITIHNYTAQHFAR